MEECYDALAKQPFHVLFIGAGIVKKGSYTVFSGLWNKFHVT
jgi:hypothetical protein